MAAAPLKRGKALMPLSREHHFDLLLAWKIRKGIKNGTPPDRIAAYIQYLDENLVARHFLDEETLLFDRLPADDPLCKQAREDHRVLRELISDICIKESKDTTLFNQLADKIEAHVRYEERELFPYLEQQLSADKLQDIEQAIAETHDGFIEKWEDEFWVKK